MKVKLLFLSLLFTISLSAQDFWWWWDSDGEESVQYALEFTSGHMRVLTNAVYNLTPSGTSNLRNSTTYMGVDDSTKAYFIFDSAYVATNLDSMTEDVSGNGNHGTVVGNLTWSSESRVAGGTSLYFDGHSYIQLPAMDITDDFTAEVWFKADEPDLTLMDQVIFSQHPNYDPGNFFARLRDYGNIEFKSIATDVSVITITSEGYNDGKWHYLACVFESGVAGHLYVDGELYHSQALTGTTISDTGNMCIGTLVPQSEIYDNYNRFKGWIQEVRFTRRALTAQEIKNYYNNFTEDYSKWTNNGNHSIADTTTAVDGTNGGRIISSGVGDAVSNNVALPIGEDLVDGCKYMVLLYAKSAYNNNDTLVVQIGDNQKKIALTDTGYVRTIYHLQSGGDDSIKVYLTKADTAFIDYIQIKRKHDYLFLCWNKPTQLSTVQRIMEHNLLGHWIAPGYSYAKLKDEFNTAISVTHSETYDTTKWNLTGFSIDWTGNMRAYLNSNSTAITTHQQLGDITIPFVGFVNFFYSAPQNFKGRMGSMVVYRFDDINASNFNITSLVNAGTTESLSSITGGGAKLVALWDWADTYNYSKAMPEINAVYGTSQYNRLTPVTITIDNRIEVKGKYK